MCDCTDKHRCGCWWDGYNAARADLRLSTGMVERQSARAEKAEAKFAEMLDCEHAVSDAYVRVRRIIGAMNPPSTTRSEALWEYVEGKAKELVARVHEIEAEMGKRYGAKEAVDFHVLMLETAIWDAAKTFFLEDKPFMAGWSAAVRCILSKAGLDKAPNAQLADMLRENERGPKGKCSLCGSKESVIDGLCRWCAAKERAKDRGPKGEPGGEKFATPTLDAALASAERGPKGEPGNPAVTWMCVKCGREVLAPLRFWGMHLHGGSCGGRLVVNYGEPGKPAVMWICSGCGCGFIPKWGFQPSFCARCGGRKVRHVWRDGAWVSEEKPS